MLIGGGGGSRTPVFRVVGGTSPSAAGGLVSDPHCPPAACADPNPAAMSRRATGPVPAVSRSIWRSGSGRAAGPGGTSLLIPKQRVRGCPRQVFLVPALSRRSGDVGSLLAPRSSKSKPRTPLSVPPRCVRGQPQDPTPRRWPVFPEVVAGPSLRPERLLSPASASGLREREALGRRCDRRARRVTHMRATFRLGRVRGIELGAHWSVVVIGGLLAYGLSGGVVDGVLWAVIVPTVLLFLASLLAHELGHSIVAQRNGMQVRGITLWMLGGVAQLDGRMPSAGGEFRIAAAGPAVSYLLGGVFLGLWGLGGALGAPSLLVEAFGWLGFVNLVLGTFNLIPAAPLDGGRILAGAVWAITGNRTRAEIVATRVGQAFGVALIVGGIVGTVVRVPFLSLWTALMGMFVYRTASMELAHARLD